MKRILIFLMPFIVMLGAGCLKHTENTDTSATIPTGTFAGQFLRIHYNRTTTKYDTLKANLTLSMDLKTGYAITGDTTAVHAGSKGDFAMDAYYIQFTDKTYSTTPVNNKIHLAGTYLYQYNGTDFQIQAVVADTLGFFYNLKKQ
jgi:hypothetical protein